MILTLEVVPARGADAEMLGRQTFGHQGGTIGRDPSSTWVLPDSKVSRCHARISWHDSVFYIEDTSVNGTFLNSRHDRLARDHPQPLGAGDRLIIGPYAISVSISLPAAGRRRQPVNDPYGVSPAKKPLATPQDLDSPFGARVSEPSRLPVNDPFRPRGRDPFSDPTDDLLGIEPAATPDRSLDPLVALKLDSPTPPPRPPSAEDLEAGDPFDFAYRPPDIVAAPAQDRAAQNRPPAPPDASRFPPGYNPLADESQVFQLPVAARSRAYSEEASHVRPGVRGAAPPRAPSADLPVAPIPTPADDDPTLGEPVPAHRAAAADGAVPAPIVPPPESDVALPAALPPPPAAPVVPTDPPPVSADLAVVLAGAGLDPTLATPDLGRQLGEILRVVVAEVRDLLESRVEAKDEFGLRRTRFLPAENNPLKFSANIDDALHNLLVKRNPAYLGPVAAFREAFDDIKRHQLAMLAGLRQAFESMLAEFDPDHLQREFDKEAGKGLLPGKLRYWDQYRDRLQTLAQDPDARFRQLFGDQFARAYAEQLAKMTESAPRRPQPPAVGDLSRLSSTAKDDDPSA